MFCVEMVAQLLLKLLKVHNVTLEYEIVVLTE